MPKLRWVIFYAAAAFIAAISVSTFMRELDRIDRLSASLDRRLARLVDITRKNQDISEKIDQYGTASGVARLAREEFNLVRPGEKIYRLEFVSRDRLINE